jgi:hypothetical protein
MAQKLQICSLEAQLAKRQDERAFLAERSDCDDLTPGHRATILDRIDRLNEQCNMLRWLLSLLRFGSNRQVEEAHPSD